MGICSSHEEFSQQPPPPFSTPKASPTPAETPSIASPTVSAAPSATASPVLSPVNSPVSPPPQKLLSAYNPSASSWTPEKENEKRAARLREIQQKNEQEIERATSHLYGIKRRTSPSVPVDSKTAAVPSTESASVSSPTAPVAPVAATMVISPSTSNAKSRPAVTAPRRASSYVPSQRNSSTSMSSSHDSATEAVVGTSASSAVASSLPVSTLSPPATLPPSKSFSAKASASQSANVDDDEELAFPVPKSQRAHMKRDNANNQEINRTSSSSISSTASATSTGSQPTSSPAPSPSLSPSVEASLPPVASLTTVDESSSPIASSVSSIASPLKESASLSKTAEVSSSVVQRPRRAIRGTSATVKSSAVVVAVSEDDLKKMSSSSHNASVVQDENTPNASALNKDKLCENPALASRQGSPRASSIQAQNVFGVKLRSTKAALPISTV